MTEYDSFGSWEQPQPASIPSGSIAAELLKTSLRRPATASSAAYSPTSAPEAGENVP